MKIGVLALQGSVAEHYNMIERGGAIAIEVRDPSDFDNIDALIIPGGESTTLKKIMKIKSLDKIITKKVKDGMPVWGTCAGLILLSSGEGYLNLIDIKAERNAYGTQHQSFSTTIDFGDSKAEVKFIRAPKIVEVGNGVDIVAEINNEPAACIYGNVLVTTFHPEVTKDLSVFLYFTGLISGSY